MGYRSMLDLAKLRNGRHRRCMVYGMRCDLELTKRVAGLLACARLAVTQAHHFGIADCDIITDVCRRLESTGCFGGVACSGDSMQPATPSANVHRALCTLHYCLGGGLVAAAGWVGGWWSRAASAAGHLHHPTNSRQQQPAAGC